MRAVPLLLLLAACPPGPTPAFSLDATLDRSAIRADEHVTFTLSTSRAASYLIVVDDRVLSRGAAPRDVEIAGSALGVGTKELQVIAYASDGAAADKTFSVAVGPSGTTGITGVSAMTGMPNPPLTVSYLQASYSLLPNEAVDLAASVTGGAATSFTIAPTGLLQGLSFSQTTGRISGTVAPYGKTIASDVGWSQLYTVTASNQDGMVSTMVTLALDLSDDFDDPNTLNDAWNVDLNSQAAATIDASSLAMTATGYSLWFNANRGPLIYKSITGDFKVSATVHVSNAAESAGAPLNNSLAGLMIRDTTTGAYDHVIMYMGRAFTTDEPLEGKTTNDGTSIYLSVNPPGASARVNQLRLCKVGAMIYYRWRPDGATTAWLPIEDVDTTWNDLARADFDGPLQVGAVLHMDNASPDMRARWDDFRFEPASSAADCDAP